MYGWGSYCEGKQEKKILESKKEIKGFIYQKNNENKHFIQNIFSLKFPYLV